MAVRGLAEEQESEWRELQGVSLVHVMKCKLRKMVVARAETPAS